MLRTKRIWLMPAIIFTSLIYYLILWPKGPIVHPGINNTQIHWVKHPEKYPVAGYRDLPTGTLPKIPLIQYDFVQHPESADVKALKAKRQQAVKDAFAHAWNGYKTHAWTRDEVAPLSGAYRSSFGGWGATLVDSMDSLWIMGFYKDFEHCVNVVKDIDFTTNEEEVLNIFETTIRYMGGLLAAYDLSEGKYPVLLTKAAELGEILYSAFDTPTHMPMTRWAWKNTALGGNAEPGTMTLLAELGSMTVEFTRLSQLTGDAKYYDLVARISEELEFWQNKTILPGLWPTLVDAKALSFDYNHFTFGGMADSTYEYLPKEWLMLGGRDNKYRKMYEEAIEAAKRYLFFRPMVPDGHDILFSGNAQLTNMDTLPISNLEPHGQHLACFVGGMVGMAAKIFDRPYDLSVARRLVDGCIWAYSAMPSGLMPETFYMTSCQIGVNEAPAGKCDWDEERWYKAIASRFSATQQTEQMSVTERGKYLAKEKLLFPGFTDHTDNRYILRPEAIESIFILYRITGDTKLLDSAWKMFEAIDRQTRTPIANAAVHDVRKAVTEKSDRMESFWLAETLKYFYLIFSDTDVISLDQWVLNTEAHPFKRPTT
ncbi:hypothetical protein B0A52_03617 [Exophiala mesophila]|uniref:alpha-1,2-Mannosidase n=1 Tax=Exophiala mesophila TaxID=212818 RepID=A0A438N9G7_EXOME|nr:hypothetical protein B0A52_03617 [Exophiala mesophila]